MPLVSVVASAFDCAPYLRAALESVLRETEVDLECIVIDDGSRDETPSILADVGRGDARLRVIRQENQGLTAALARACQLARGEIIVRQDADDLSLPGRIRRQVDVLLGDPRVALVAGWVHVIGPNDEPLYDETWPEDSAIATAGLRRDGRSVAHGSVAFRKTDYERVGGYRAPFRFAQDVDLWLRLTDHGWLAVVPAFHYALRVHGRSIGAARRRQQEELASLARAAMQCRAAQAPEDSVLARAAAVSGRPVAKGHHGQARSDYFVGKCLLKRRDARAIPYLWRCVRGMPWHGRAWASLMAAPFITRSTSTS